MRFNHPTEEQVRDRAFELYVERGGLPGHELDDWLQAEFELAHLPFHVEHLQPIRARKRRGGNRRGGRPSISETSRVAAAQAN